MDCITNNLTVSAVVLILFLVIVFWLMAKASETH